MQSSRSLTRYVPLRLVRRILHVELKLCAVAREHVAWDGVLEPPVRVLQGRERVDGGDGVAHCIFLPENVAHSSNHCLSFDLMFYDVVGFAHSRSDSFALAELQNTTQGEGHRGNGWGLTALRHRKNQRGAGVCARGQKYIYNVLHALHQDYSANKRLLYYDVQHAGTAAAWSTTRAACTECPATLTRSTSTLSVSNI